METEVIASTEWSACDIEQFRALELAVYGPHEQRDDPFARITWALPEFSVVARQPVDGRIVAHAGILARDCLLNGETVRIGGLGEVKTHPDVRGQRIGRAVVARACELLRDDLSVDFGLLVCGHHLLSYYQQLGWSEFHGELWVEQSEGQVRFESGRVMVMPGRQPAPANGVIDLLGLPW